MRTNCLMIGFAFTTLLTAGTAAGADPRLMNLVMPDATTLAGANVTNAKNTPFGQYVLAQMTSAIDQQLQSFVTATGFDPRQDVSEILAASAGSVASPTGLVMALGNFQVAQMTTAISLKAPELTVQNYGGATLITGSSTPTGTSKKISVSIAFFGTTVSVVGDTASVKAAIDRSTGVNSIAPALATQIAALSTAQDAWVVTTNPVSSLLAGLTAGDAAGAGMFGQISQMFRGIQGSSGGIKFGSSVEITGQAITADATTAKSLADVMTALISIAQMGVVTAPQGTTGQNSQMASLAQLLQAVKVTSDGAMLNLAMSIPEAQLESLLNGLKSGAKPAARPAMIRPAMAVGN